MLKSNREENGKQKIKRSQIYILKISLTIKLKNENKTNKRALYKNTLLSGFYLTSYLLSKLLTKISFFW